VGKRRKRPLDDSIGTVNSQSWVVQDQVPIQSIPSPATTNRSDESSKRLYNTSSWASDIAGGFLKFDDTTGSLSAIDMADCRGYSTASDLSFFHNSGLPTPGLSPPRFPRYLSPAQLETRPSSSHWHSPCSIDHAKLYPGPQRQPSFPPKIDLELEDEETVCIKLLAHLKKHSDESQPPETQVDLLNKSNSAVRRILRSKSIRSNYSCHLLLSSIINHLVRLCEGLCQVKEEGVSFVPEQVHFQGMPGFFDTPVPHAVAAIDQELMSGLVKEVATFTSVVGDFLKKKPIYGFQHLGRHETFHVELEQRLKKATVLLQA